MAEPFLKIDDNFKSTKSAGIDRKAKKALQDRGYLEKGADYYSFETDQEIKDRLARTEQSRREQIADPGLFDTFSRGFSSGIDNLQGSLYGITGLIGDLVGSEGLKEYGFKRSAENKLEASETYLPIDSFISGGDRGAFGSLSNFAYGVSQNFGEALPSLLESLAFAVGGAAVGSQAVPGIGPDDAVAVPAGAISGWFGKNALKKHIDDLVLKKGLTKEAAEASITPQIEREIISNSTKMLYGRVSAGLATGLTEAGSNYSDLALSNGIEAPMTSLMFGLVSGASESMFGVVPLSMKSFMRSPLASAVKKKADDVGSRNAFGWMFDVMKSGARGFAEEGAQEGFQAFLSSLNREVNDPNFKITDKETFLEWMDSAARGALVGGPITAGSTTLAKARDSFFNPVQTERIPGENGIEITTINDNQLFKDEDSTGRLTEEGQKEIFKKYVDEIPQELMDSTIDKIPVESQDELVDNFIDGQGLVSENLSDQAQQDFNEAAQSTNDNLTQDQLDNITLSGAKEFGFQQGSKVYEDLQRMAENGNQEAIDVLEERQKQAVELLDRPEIQSVLDKVDAIPIESLNAGNEKNLIKIYSNSHLNLLKGNKLKDAYDRNIADFERVGRRLQVAKERFSSGKSKDSFSIENNYKRYRVYKKRVEQLSKLLEEEDINPVDLEIDDAEKQIANKKKREEELKRLEEKGQEILGDESKAEDDLEVTTTTASIIPTRDGIKTEVKNVEKETVKKPGKKESLKDKQKKKKPSLKDKQLEKRKDEFLVRFINQELSKDGPHLDKKYLQKTLDDFLAGEITKKQALKEIVFKEGELKEYFRQQDSTESLEYFGKGVNGNIIEKTVPHPDGDIEVKVNWPAPPRDQGVTGFTFPENPTGGSTLSRPKANPKNKSSIVGAINITLRGGGVNGFRDRSGIFLEKFDEKHINKIVDQVVAEEQNEIKEPKPLAPLAERFPKLVETSDFKPVQSIIMENTPSTFYIDAVVERTGWTDSKQEMLDIKTNRELVEYIYDRIKAEKLTPAKFRNKLREVMTVDGTNYFIEGEKSYKIDDLTGGDKRKSLKQKQAEKKAEKNPSEINPTELSVFFDGRIQDIIGTKMDNRKLKKLVSEYAGIPVTKLTQKNGYKHKDVQEALERSIVKHAKTLLTGDIDADYKALRDLYNNQPLLNARTGGSIARQAYSTPIHYAYLANLFADANNPKAMVYEPTAGNGALVLASNPDNVFANELDPFRKETLEQLGFNDVTAMDASKPLFKRDQFDSVVMNPPFGSLKKAEMVNGARIKKLEHVIALNALSSLKKDGGRASIIIGGSLKGKQTLNDKVFLNQIRKEFNVEGYYNIDGKEYARQGTTFPTVLIVVGPKTDSAPDIDFDKVWTVDEVFNELKKERNNGKLARSKNYDYAESVSRSHSASNQQQSGTGDLRGQTGDESSGQSDGRLGSDDTGDTGLRSDTDGRLPTRLDTKGADSERDSGSVGTKKTDTTSDSVPSGRDTDRTDGGTESVSTDQANNTGSSVESQPRPRVDIKETVGEFQSTYSPESKGTTVETNIPNNQRQPIKEALKRLTEMVGDIDTFVQDKLGYKNHSDLYKAFSAEQIDALGLGIYNSENSKSLIIGDQTGVGKGRVAAGMLRYAMQRGMKPIFVTEKPGLFSDMYRDLNDIYLGEKLPKPFVVNGATKDAKIIDPNGFSNVKIKNNETIEEFASRNNTTVDQIKKDNPNTDLSKAKSLSVRDPGKIFFKNTGNEVTEFNSMMKGGKTVKLKKGETLEEFADRNNTTIEQLRIDNPKKKNFDTAKSFFVSGNVDYSFDEDADLIMTTYSQFKQVIQHKVDYLLNRSEAGFMVLDESHNAAGDSYQGRVTKDMLGRASGAVYLSATYAKTPKNMSVYDKTVIGRTGLSSEALADVLLAGGTPMQEFLSEALVLSGEYVRREKSFDGVETKVIDVPTNKSQKAEYDEVVEFYQELIRIDKLLAPEIVRIAEVKVPAGERYTASSNASSTLEAGNFSSTVHNNISQLLLALKIDATVKDAVEQVKAGNKVVITLANTMESILPDTGKTIGVDFRATLDRAITNILKASYRNLDNKPDKVIIKEEELSKDSQAIIQELRKEVRALNIELPASPIDSIVQGIQDAGISIEELTGRSKNLNREGKVVPRSRPGTAEVINQFNNGDLQVIVANEVIATGFSLHASEKFSQQQKRVMLLAQTHLDINKVMQMLGRVNRTGQVVKPEYRYIKTDLPAETRPFTMFMKKMKSLNANTSANAESETSLEGQDIMNKYGDAIVAEYFKENMRLAGSLNLTSTDEDGKATLPPTKDFAKRATGRLALAPIKEQKAFWDFVLPTYKEFIDELNLAGQNDINSQFLDFKAELLREELLYPGDLSNPLTGPVKSGIYKVKILSKPFKRQQVIDMAEKNKEAVESLKSAVEEKNPQVIERLKENAEKESDPDKKQSKMDLLRSAEKKLSLLRHQIGDLEIGKYYTWNPEKDDLFKPKGVLIDVKFNKKVTNVTPSSIKLVFAVNNGRRKITRPMTQIKGLYLEGWGNRRGEIPANWDDSQSQSFEERIIITGNILKGMDFANKNRGTTGKPNIITFSDKDGKIHRGALLHKGAKVNANAVKFMPVNKDQLYILLDNGVDLFSAGKMKVQRDGADWKVTFPVKGGKAIVSDPELNAIEKTGDFQKVDNEYVGFVALDDIVKYASLKGMGFNVARTDKNLELVSERSEINSDKDLEDKVNPDVINKDLDPNADDTKFRTETPVEYNDLSRGDKLQAMRIVKKMTGTRNLKFTEKLFSEKGLEVLGKYKQQFIEISEGLGNVEETARHEALHFAYDVLLTEEEARSFDRAAKELGWTHEEAIEKVNEFAHNTKGLPGKLRTWGGRIIRRIKSLFGADNAIDTLNDIYDRAISGKLAKREIGSSNYTNVQRFEGGHALFREREALNKAAILDVGRIGDAYDFARKAINNFRDPNKGAKQDLLPLDRIIRSIAFYSERVPALKRVFDIGNKFRDDKVRIARMMFHENNGDGHSNFDDLIKYTKLNKKDWKKLQEEYLWKKDLDQNGYTVIEDDNGFYKIVDPKGKADSHKFETEDEAWHVAFYHEKIDMIESGWSTESAESVLSIRKMMRRQFKILSGNAERLKSLSQKFGIDNPIIGDTTLFDLFEELKKMGQLSGSYIPRLRTGRQMLWAKKEGENSRLELFDTRAARALRAAKLKREGYTIENDESNTPSQDSFLEGGSIVAINDLINNALQRAEADANNLSDLGIMSSTHEYVDAAKRKRNNLVISGDEAKQYAKIFESFGGKQEGDSWVFRNKSKEKISQLEKSLAGSIHNFNGTKVLEFEAFGRSLAEQMAIMFHSKGSRARKISRDGKKGKDVFLGFEDDILKAVSLSVTATAGGTAKRNMARNMIDAMTGRDLKWDEYLKNNMDPNLVKGTEEWYNAKIELWPQYQEAVRERSIESAKQPLAFKDGLDYIKDMVRNEEPSERIMGNIRALAALKYLSGISSGLVNLTALGTVVPGAMSHFGNIDISKSFGLLAKASTNYTKYMLYSKFGKGKELDVDSMWLFDEITKRGWDADLQNEEALGVTRNFGGRIWNEILEKSLFVFGATERLNRASTIAASYNGLVANHEGKLTEADKQKYLQTAKTISDKSHGVYGKPNLPAWARGSGAGQVGRAWFMFQTFTHNYFQLLAQLASRKDYKALAWMTVSPAIIGGASASLLTPVLAGLAQAIPGFEAPEDPEEEFYNFVGEYAGEYAESFARHGIAGLGGKGVSLRGSLAIRTELPIKISDLGGASFSSLNDIYTGLGQLVDGNVQKGFESISPRILSSVIKSHREYTEGVTNNRDQPIFYGDERLKASLGESVWRSFGFNPVGIAEKRQRQWSDVQIESQFRDDKSEIYNGIRRFLLNGGSKADWQEHLKAIEEYNARVSRSGNTNIPLITERSLKGVQNAINNPNRRERLRQKEISGNDERELPDFSNFSFNSARGERLMRMRENRRKNR